MISVLAKTKFCTKCNNEYPITLEYFSPDRRNKDGLQSWCRGCIKKHHKHYGQTEKGIKWRKQYNRLYYQNHCTKCSEQHKQWYQKHRKQELKKSEKYRNTIEGYLRHLYSAIKQRCNNSKIKNYKYYGGKGIKCLFRSADEFIDYVINKLQIDPRGLDVDRIDNNRHYEHGNIRFVTHKENCNNKF